MDVSLGGGGVGSDAEGVLGGVGCGVGVVVAVPVVDDAGFIIFVLACKQEGCGFPVPFPASIEGVGGFTGHLTGCWVDARCFALSRYCVSVWFYQP